MNINFKKKFFFFKFLSKIQNSKEFYNNKKGLIVKLNSNDRKEGFGEISPLLKDEIYLCKKQINQIPNDINKNELIEKLINFHPCIQSGINSALAEMEGKIKFKEKYKFNEIDQSAILLDSYSILEELFKLKHSNISGQKILTIKWKVGLRDNKIEENILEEILNQNEHNIRLRIDANGSWSRECANRWAEILKDNTNLDWLEQPLAVDDFEGLNALNQKIPVALDESLIKYPQLINKWNGWQIRRPSQESNPILLLEDLKNNIRLRSISTSFETGIGNRLIYHFSELQLLGATPKVPGLALKQMPSNLLFQNNAKHIWDNL